MTAPRDVYLVAAEAAVAVLDNCTPVEFLASRQWFRAALDAGEAHLHPLPPPPINPFREVVLRPEPESDVRHAEKAVTA